MAKKEGSSDIFNVFWDFFTSVKLTVVVLLALAATSIVGTLIPQNENPVVYLQAYGEVVYRIFYTLDIFDMYHSWWFQFLLVMLAANVTVCSLERLSGTWKIVFVTNPVFHVPQFQKTPHAEEFDVSGGPKVLKEPFGRTVSKRFGYNRIEAADTGYHIFAETGRWTRLGVYGVHLSVLVLLLGGIIGSLFGFEGFVNIPEGETVDSIRLRKNNESMPLGFAIRCEDFDVQFYATGAPKEFRSRLTVLEGGKPVLQKDIIVNDPLRHKGINVFQSSYGALSASGATLQFKSASTGMIYSQAAVMGQPVKIPESGGSFVLNGYRNGFQFRGRNLGEAFVGVLTPSNGSSAEVILPVRFADFDRMRKGEWIVSVSDPQYRYYTGLQVTRDPGVWVVYTGFILMIVGCYVTFFMTHQRVCITVRSRGNQSAVRVAGTSNKNPLATAKRVKILSKQLRDAL